MVSSIPEIALEPLYFMVMGLVGSVVYVIIKAKGWKDFTTFESWKRYILGPFAGLLYNLLYSEYNFPNSVMAVVFGYFSIDLIPWIMKFLRDIIQAIAERSKKDE